MDRNHLAKLMAAVIVVLLYCSFYAEAQSPDANPLRIGIARMTHGHVVFILDRLQKNSSGLILTGIFEPDPALAEKYAKAYMLDRSLFFDDLENMLGQTKPEAVLAFGSIIEHLMVVEACAPKGIHVMVEKPLAVNMDHASKMKALSDRYGTFVLTNFETSWYPSTAKSWQLLNDSLYIGLLRKAVIHDGHEGPREIGCSPEFLEWLTDPVKNGGGAIVDFGCYGANLMTYLTRGETPVSVTAVTRQFKPELYPNVDDDAILILSYPESECIIQASWNWPFGRKDMELYGNEGYIMADNRNDMRLKNRLLNYEVKRQISATETGVYEDPFTYFAEVIRGKVRMKEYDPYSITNNMIVVRILDAARESARTGAAVKY